MTTRPRGGATSGRRREAVLQGADLDAPALELHADAPIRLFRGAAVRARGLVHRLGVLRQLLDDVVVGLVRGAR